MSRRERFRAVYEEYGKPAVDKILDAIGRSADETTVRKALRQQGTKPIRGLSDNPASRAIAQAATPRPRTTDQPTRRPPPVEELAVKPGRAATAQSKPSEKPLAAKPYDIPVYHGTTKDFEALDPLRARAGLGAYATPNRDFAAEFAQGDGRVISGNLQPEKVVDLSDFGAFPEQEALRDIAANIGADPDAISQVYRDLAKQQGDVHMFSLLENAGVEIPERTAWKFQDWGQGAPEPAYVFSDPALFARGDAAASAVEELAVKPSAPKPKEKPKYERTETGPYLQVRRAGQQPRTVPAAREARTIDDLREILQDPTRNLPAQAADEYTQSAFGRGYDTNFEAPETSLMKQSGIARAFMGGAEGSPAYKSALFERYGEMMPEVVEGAGAQNYDQLTEAAYRQLAEEARGQFDALPVGMQYHFGEGEYKAPSAMLRDILGEGNLNVFRGGDPHPYLSDIDPDTGLTSNEMFRAVHDYFGHGTRGATFRPGGEELAYASHSQMMSPLARMALLAETRGQNSVVNYSPLNVDVLAEQNQIKDVMRRARLKAEMRGEPFDASQFPEQSARLRELGEQYQYAPQTPLLLPPEYLPADTRGGLPDYIREILRPAAPTGPERAVHLSRVEDLGATDPAFYGSGHRGDDWRVRGQKGSPSTQTSFYLGPQGTVKPEQVVADVNPYAYEAELSNLYDIETDPEQLIALARAYNTGSSAIPDFKRLVREYGYTGYRAPFGPQYAANVYDPVELQRRITRGPGGYAQGGLACAG